MAKQYLKGFAELGVLRVLANASGTYTTDSTSYRAIEKQIAALDKEENERLFEQQTEERRHSLEEQQEEVKRLSDEKQSALSETLSNVTSQYEKLTNNMALQGQARNMITSQSSQSIADFINRYAPQYETLGQSIGDSLLNGIKSKVGSISDYVSGIAKATDTVSERNTAAALLQSFINSYSSRIASYRDQMNSIGTAAAQSFNGYNQDSSSGSAAVYMTVNFNDKVNSPIEVKRQLESVGYTIAKQIQR